jgi:hypothetical protein
MSRALSPSFARCYGLARVARVWKISRASVYRSLKQTPPTTITCRPGAVGACSDAELADARTRRNARHWPMHLHWKSRLSYRTLRRQLFITA